MDNGLNNFTYICCLTVVIKLLEISSETKVGDFENVLVGNQHISGCQISMNTLKHTSTNIHLQKNRSKDRIMYRLTYRLHLTYLTFFFSNSISPPSEVDSSVVTIHTKEIVSVLRLGR